MATTPFPLLSPAISLPGNDGCGAGRGQRGDAGMLVARSRGHPQSRCPRSAALQRHLPGEAPATLPVPGAPGGKGSAPLLASGPLGWTGTVRRRGSSRGKGSACCEGTLHHGGLANTSDKDFNSSPLTRIGTLSYN